VTGGGTAERAIPFIGLTGGIAAGKSAALAALRELGAGTLSSDDVVHELLTGGELRELLTERFGPEVAPGGQVDRGRIAAVVFERPEEREWLEGVLWPRVGQRIADWREDQARRRPPPPAAVVEVPLLFEAGMEPAFDLTVAVVADEEVRAGRAGERGHGGVDARTARQLTQDEKAARADVVVRNDGTLEALQQRMADVLEQARA
jgi:dephospho-CoA kinase